jgi:hypothetical protein
MQVAPQLGTTGRVKAGSPMRNAGSPAFSVSPDIDGENRDAQPDLGCDEFIDADGDTLPDYWEKLYGLSPSVYHDPSADSDGDGLTNAQEADLETNPLASDSDDDGLNDAEEVMLGTNPLSPDTDGDGLYDGDEVDQGTNPNSPDTDGDGIPDPDDPAPNDNGMVDDLVLYVDSDGGAPQQGIYKTQNVTIPQGTKAVYYKVTVFSREYPTYTSSQSIYDDVVTWTMEAPSPLQGQPLTSYNVNALHNQYGPGDFPGGNVVVKEGVLNYETLTQNGPSWLNFEATAKNVSDSALGSGVGIQVSVLKVEFETFADDETREIGGSRSPNWKAHTLNLDTKQDEENHYGDYKKCVAHIWSNQPLNLAKYLSDYVSNQEIFENPDVLNWKIDGQLQTSFELDLEMSAPNENRYKRYNVEVLFNFDQWLVDNQDTGWLAELPALYSTVQLDVSLDAMNPEPSSLACSNWKDNKPFSMFFDMGADTYYHPDADHEIRSEETPEGHGHQACYNEDGELIRSGVSAGTADRAFYANISGTNSHVNLDAIPFVWAVQLDGTPAQGEVGIWPDYSSMDNPIMHEGKFIGEYIDLRPPIANDRTELMPGNCP